MNQVSVDSAVKNQKGSVLIIDDEVSICKFLRVSLEAESFLVREAHSGSEGLQSLVNTRADLVILDLGLPDLDGLNLLSQLREWSKVPVIVLTVQDNEERKVQALDSGADDYLTKPFSVAELKARIRVALRHALPRDQSPVFKNGPLKINRESRSVFVNEKAVKLTSTEYSILCLFAEHLGKIVTHRKVLNEVWGPQSVEHTQYLRVYVGQIRKKLKISEEIPDFIETESGVGYRMLGLETHPKLF